MLNNALGVNAGVSRIMLVIIFLHAGFLPMGKISTSVPAVASHGAGNVVRSFVLLTSIPKRVIRIPTLRNLIQRNVVNKSQDSNKTRTALVDIIVIVRSGGINKS